MFSDTSFAFFAVLFELQVKDLSGENMKKYWTLEEVERIPL